MNKTVLIIGASRGIGRELVLNFAQDSSVRVIALSRNVKAMKESFSAPNVDVFGFDLTSPKRKEELAEILSPYPHIDFVINNAGMLVNKPFLELTSKDIRGCYEVNAMSVMECTQVVVPRMLAAGGHIVNISTMGGFQGTVKFPGLSAYSSSKAAVVSFTELFAEEFKDTKIAMNCLCLGAAQTEMLEEAFPGYEAPLTAQQMAQFICDFTRNSHHYMRGKVLPVSLSTP
ncbi:MAG: SDR family NAD(P)-dependent oxidoreductase [Crocinitomicaceae bacterium]|nr:SDR family NAD(P)-dependent oxidoreductase [Crocinitomicaceae bacterium]